MPRGRVSGRMWTADYGLPEALYWEEKEADAPEREEIMAYFIAYWQACTLATLGMTAALGAFMLAGPRYPQKGAP